MTKNIKKVKLKKCLRWINLLVISRDRRNNSIERENSKLEILETYQ